MFKPLIGRKVLKSLGALILVLTAFTGVGHAATISFTAANGATATADFTFGANSLTVVLTDTSVNPTEVAFNLSAVSFSFAGGTGATLASASSPILRTVNSDGTFSDAAGPSTVATVGWAFTSASNTYTLDVLSGAGHAGPANTILGLPGGSNLYSNAGGSIAGNGAHNPFLENSATFGFTFTGGVTADTALSNVQLQFGTTDGTFECASGCTPFIPSVPEPSSIITMGLGLLVIGVSGRKFLRGSK